MVDQSPRSLDDLVRHLGRYPEEAFLFVRAGLSYAAERVHGPESDAHRVLQQFLLQNDLDWPDLIERHRVDDLPPPVLQAVKDAGGCERLNRHISGRDLCWSLRDFAVQRWGLLAKLVLESWNIHSTRDFGRIVYGFIDFDMMRKQNQDRIEDFDDVFGFDQTFSDLVVEPLDGNGPARRPRRDAESA